ncbi:Hook-related protein family [Phaffia rhodozyma]|uniref:Hook-related protein family n=1 Tax=Phaffia rhodozyma TaxID=264483 RepID=A0A0F7SSH1_PHARH|nr:Hook-related protein family [Phaffia rhodozyma]
MSSLSAARSRQSRIDSSKSEAKAYVSLFRAFSSQIQPPIRQILDLKDAKPFGDFLTILAPESFSEQSVKIAPRSSPRDSSANDWVTQYNSLKRLHRALNIFAEKSLGQPPNQYPAPNLQAMSKGDEKEILAFCRIVVGISVQATPGNEVIISKITTLEQADQQSIMLSIKPLLDRANPSETPTLSSSLPSASNEAEESPHESERARLALEKLSLESSYNTLKEEHNTLKEQLADVLKKNGKEGSMAADSNREDSNMRSEIDRLKDEFDAELALDKQTQVIESLTRRVEELNHASTENVKLKDQLDEYKHAANRLQKSENANKKLNQKLEESAGRRRQLKALEEENASLVDKNAALEEDIRKAAPLKRLNESYTIQIARCEDREKARLKENSELSFELEQARARLQKAEQDLTSSRDELELNHERIRELELNSADGRSRRRSESDEDEDGAGDVSMIDELNETMQGTTKTDLKLQVRRLQRELENSRTDSIESSKVAVLENLLDDARKMKDRYEQDYLASHKANLTLQADLEGIRNGKSLGDGPEAASALRLKLNQVIGELDSTKEVLAELETKYNKANQELTVAKSDLTLVNKDQIDILHMLRESVNEDKVQLESDLMTLKQKLVEAKEKNHMQVDQINGLLLEKINLQSDGIGHREKMIERERTVGDLRVTLAGRDIPDDVKTRLLDLSEEKLSLSIELARALEQVKSLTDHVQNAKKFMREQDTVIKDQKEKMTTGVGEQFAEARQSYETQISTLQKEVQKKTANIKEISQSYAHQFQVLLSAYQEIGLKISKDHARGVGVASSVEGRGNTPQGTSWLAQQRMQLTGGLRR